MKKTYGRRKRKLSAMIVCSTSNSLDIKQNHDHAPNSARTFQYSNTSLLQLSYFKIPANLIHFLIRTCLMQGIPTNLLHFNKSDIPKSQDASQDAWVHRAQKRARTNISFYSILPKDPQG